ncbi:hypothetical protein [Proteiniclasticum sp. QWL-01]|uniref:hypothetical protein n=1 Tax=Proteiniclasticum sp. QWL-01 TaxID=3036945 RepID=UPI00240EC52E|nr:hypothetical protein [Proteiniclasticum sp. QWL-01]WFF72619.1 hypothetical protein P6M73_15305 [Proteiniclasticum sp. QWL-01]
MTVNIPSSSLIACICEGGAETAIMDILLNQDLLVFSRDQMIEESVLPRTSVKEFERRHLRLAYDQKILILRVIDSRGEKFNLSRAYRSKVKVIDVITAPEIEMLIIVSKKKYDEYCRSKIKKPSDYCKNVLKIKNVKSPAYISKYFADPFFLLESIKEYQRVHKQKNNEASLYDLIKTK